MPASTRRRRHVESSFSMISTGVVSGDPSVADDFTRRVGEADCRRPRDDERDGGRRPAPQTGEPLTQPSGCVVVPGRRARSRTGYGGALGPAEHEDVGDDVGTQRVQVAGITCLSGGAGKASARSIAAMTLSASLTR